jgi:amino acid transporter
MAAAVTRWPQPLLALRQGCSALIIDYVLTIAISIASAVDSLFSVMPQSFQGWKLPIEVLLIMILTSLNLRGMKESIKILMPIFLGFVITHVAIIIYGIVAHHSGLHELWPEAVRDAKSTAADIGWFAVLALFFKAFSMGGGTYTGLESVSNAVQNLAEPRVKTGKSTMFCVAASLAFMATGIILLYLLWDVRKIEGETMNATTFSAITAHWEFLGYNVSHLVVSVMMFLTAGLLFVAANTGFIAGPAVLANMAVDRWMPSFFSSLSSRLVTKNGVLLMGTAAIVALALTLGKVSVLVVLYSINVFLTFSLSLLGLTIYRWKKRHRAGNLRKLMIPLLALIVCVSILITTILEKFMDGGWMTLIITGFVIFMGVKIKGHYEAIQESIEKVEDEMEENFIFDDRPVNEGTDIDYSKPTAVFLVKETSASGIQLMQWVEKTFPKMFYNYVFVSVGEIDTEEFVDQNKWDRLRRDTKQILKKYVRFCNHRGIPATYYHSFGTDIVKMLTDLTDKIAGDFPNSMFFASKVISDNENILTQILHNQTAYILQRRLHSAGHNLIIMPVKL